MAADSRSDASPMNERFLLDDVILGLVVDLQELRARKITINDAQARAELAKQIFNGVRLAINAQHMLEGRARRIEERERAEGAQ